MRFLVSEVETWKPSEIFIKIVEADSEVEAIKKFLIFSHFESREEFDEEYPEEDTKDWDFNDWCESMFNRQVFIDVMLFKDLGIIS